MSKTPLDDVVDSVTVGDIVYQNVHFDAAASQDADRTEMQMHDDKPYRFTEAMIEDCKGAINPQLKKLGMLLSK